MGQTVKPTRQNRTITVDFHDETTYAELLDNTKAWHCQLIEKIPNKWVNT